MTKILLPVDGSGCSLDTVKWAAKSLDKSIHKFHLLYIIHSGEGCSVMEHLEKEAQEILDDAKDHLEKAGAQVVKTDFRLGSPWEEICAYADDIHAEVVLMGSHGRTKLDKVFMGSVSQKVMENCKHPLIIYREKERISGLDK